MKTLTIVIDIRCCNEKKVVLSDFENSLKRNFSEYDINFIHDSSSLDVICTQGYKVVELQNSSSKEQKQVETKLEQIFYELSEV